MPFNELEKNFGQHCFIRKICLTPRTDLSRPSPIPHCRSSLSYLGISALLSPKPLSALGTRLSGSRHTFAAPKEEEKPCYNLAKLML